MQQLSGYPSLPPTFFIPILNIIVDSPCLFEKGKGQLAILKIILTIEYSDLSADEIFFGQLSVRMGRVEYD